MTKKETERAGATVKLNVKTPPPPVTPTAAAAASTLKIADAEGASHAVKVEGGEMLKKPEFLERVMTRTDVKKSQAKPAIEAALATLAEALMNGEELQLPPMGKLKVVKARDIGDGAQVLTLKLRTMKDSAGQG